MLHEEQTRTTEVTFEITPIDNTSLSLLLRHLDNARNDLAKRVARLKEANDRIERHLSK